jgi:poly(A) polymerase/tRNA nucleotidyltransferase (CCA-adding enzyme)
MAELQFALDSDTAEGIKVKAVNLAHISRERIRDEFVKMLMSKDPMMAINMAHMLGVLKYISPTLEEGVGIEQNQAHSYDVFGHLTHALQHAADKDWQLDLRIAALFHDISKPETRRWSDEKKDWTFHGHEVVGSRVTKKILEDLHFSREMIEKVTKLVRWHMFFSDPDQITLSAVRRMITNVGQENIWDLLNLRICDRVGTGRPKEQPFRFRKYKAMVEQALRDPISVSMLKTDGERLMGTFHMKPGPEMGNLLNALLEEVLDDPLKNTEEYLDRRTGELLKLTSLELKELGEAGKKKQAEAELAEIKKIERKNNVG